MPGNDVACCLRLTNRAAAAALKGARYGTVRLSERVPHAAFAWRWAAPDSARCLTSAQRRQLLALTAAAGEVANLRLLLDLQWAGALTPGLFCAAAAGGQLEACQLLRARDCPWGSWTTAAAAGADRREVVEWLVANDVPQGWDWRSAQSAARAGHVGLVRWLLPRVGPSMRYYKGSFLAAAAEGCSLSALHGLMCAVLDGQPPAELAAASAATSAPGSDAEAAEAEAAALAGMPEAETRGSREEWLKWGKEVLGWDRYVMLAAAAGSDTPDWRQKVAFLERFAGFLPPAAAAAAAAGSAAGPAATTRNKQAARGVAGAPQGAAPPRDGFNPERRHSPNSDSASICKGSGTPSQESSSEDGDGGDGAQAQRDSDEDPGFSLFRNVPPLSPEQAPQCGMAAIRVMRRHTDWRQRIDWLAGRGYRITATAAAAAAEAGNAEALEYLLGRLRGELSSSSFGREVSSAAVRGDLPVLRLLRPHMAGDMAADAAELAAAHGQLPVVAWLLGQGAAVTQQEGSGGGVGAGGEDAGGVGDAGRGAGAAAAGSDAITACMLTAALFRAAAKSGSIELLQWLRDRGCPWDSRAWVTAASDSSQQVVEWLAEAGCPMPSDGEPYLLPAREGDTPMLRCLHRLGCPLGPPAGGGGGGGGGGLLTRVLATHLAPVDGGGLRGLRCLVEELGCCVDWEAALEATEQWRGRDQREVAAWLVRLREEREAVRVEKGRRRRRAG
ncbi:hypothetical protein HYH02_001733 [Chlamydomonas schloesseri]|uniref:Ankyrin repeat domain-containing protein n=1 Tax=Chlamydomonas schloesseri TaxID=2026947 RepID=A0A835WUH8_9CHLO|nr:hypothetical protein HYH02_001733 [Chlamydomonas schloesseri]|eukprot:KAG2453513.1 hypothetical protein HYH02_001733 [Chlamydomonas schloesseri]